MRERVLYVGGAARSGSTVLGRILAATDGFVWAGELVWLPRDLQEDRVCSCGASASTCPFWIEVRERLGWDDVALGKHRRAIWRGRHWGWWAGGDGSADVYEAIAQTSGATTVVDTSKYAARAWWVRGASDAQLIWLRQAPDALLSRLTRTRVSGRSFGLVGALVYALWVDRCWSVLSRQTSVVEVSTHELYADPEAVLERLTGISDGHRWSSDQALPMAHALTGHARAMHDSAWTVSTPAPLGRWARLVAEWMSRRSAGAS